MTQRSTQFAHRLRSALGLPSGSSHNRTTGSEPSADAGTAFAERLREAVDHEAAHRRYQKQGPGLLLNPRP